MAERPEDLNLPQSVIGRIMKDAVPDGVSVSKEARNAVSKAASVFVLYATSCANNQALQAKRKTLSANDVFQALRDMEFEEFIEPLQASLEEFRKDQKTKKEAQEQRKKVKDNSGDSSGGGKDATGGAEDKTDEDEDDEGIEEEEEEEDDDGNDDEDDDDDDDDDDGDDGWVEEKEVSETKEDKKEDKKEDENGAGSTAVESMEEGS
ncbi:DNA polymerase epsilon subunit 3-like [Apostichopus japonicus]|uniref:DNA polymerase epsilon subunit 3-like n=1 Tax=Stichopus japonicus TaxID=307972 RepID=UPI003AB73D77